MLTTAEQEWTSILLALYGASLFAVSREFLPLNKILVLHTNNHSINRLPSRPNPIAPMAPAVRPRRLGYLYGLALHRHESRSLDHRAYPSGCLYSSRLDSRSSIAR